MTIQQVIQGEAKTITFTEANSTDLSSATLALEIKGTTITKTDTDFDDTNEASGITAVVLTAANSAALDPGKYTMILTITFSATNIDKSTHILEVFEE